MKFHEKMFNLRKKRRLSQEELAEKLDVSRQAISKWETGDAIPETTKLITIAKFFDVTVDYLLDDEIDEYIPPELSKNIDTADKIFSKSEILFKKYGWLSGLLIIILGIYRIINSIVSIVTVWQGIMHTGNSAFIMAPVIQVLIGIALIIVGVILIKKLKK